MEQENGADVALKIAGQEVNLRNVKSLNTIATVCTLLGVCIIGVYLHFHEVNAQTEKAQVAATLQKSNVDIAAILKEATQAQREQGQAIVKALERVERRAAEVACLSDPTMKNRNDAREFCRRMSRDDR